MWTISSVNGPASIELAGLDVLELDLAQLVLVQARAGHRHRELAPVDRRRVLELLAPDLAQDPRQRADVVLVRVGDDDRLDVVGALAQVGEVRAGRGRRRASRRSGTAGRSRRRRSSRRTRRRSCSCRSRPGRRAGRTRSVPLNVRTGSSRPWRSSAARSCRALVLVEPRRAAGAGAPTRMAEEVERRLDRRSRFVVTAERLVERRAAPASISRAVVGLVDHAAHLVADEVAGDEDAAGLAEVEHVGRAVVVAGVEVEPVDRREVRVVGLLDRRRSRRSAPSSASRSFGMSMRRCAAGCCRGRPACRSAARDRLVVRDEPAAVRLVVVRRDRAGSRRRRARSPARSCRPRGACRSSRCPR